MTVLPPTRQQLPDHAAYHDTISVATAEEKLKEKSGPCFLFRYSKTYKCYQIAIKYENEVEYIKVEIDKDAPSYQLQGSEKIFTSLDELVKYYQNNALSPTIRNIGQPCQENNTLSPTTRNIGQPCQENTTLSPTTRNIGQPCQENNTLSPTTRNIGQHSTENTSSCCIL